MLVRGALSERSSRSSVGTAACMAVAPFHPPAPAVAADESASDRQPAVDRPSVVAPRKASLRAITSGSDDTDKVLTGAYTPGITQRAYVGAVLAEDSSIRPKVAEEWWKSRRLLTKVRREESEVQRGRNQRPKNYLASLSDDQRDALEELFYGEFRGTVGVRALWDGAELKIWSGVGADAVLEGWSLKRRLQDVLARLELRSSL